MVRAWPFKQPLKVVHGTLGGLLASLTVARGHNQALASLFVLLLDGTVGGTFTDVHILLCLDFEVVEDRSDRLLARGVAGGDVDELFGGSWALTSQLVNQGLAGGPK